MPSWVRARGVATRDRAGAERRLLDAVGQVLRDEGVPGLGVNALARRAGLDKVLIYRYFGGLDGLVRRWADSTDFWPSAEELLGPDDVLLQEPDRARLGRLFLERYVDALRRRPHTVQLLAWEVAASHPLLSVLEEAREAWALRLQARLAPLGLPAAVLTLANLHIAAIHYLLARSRHTATFGGTGLQDEAGWRSIFDAMERSLSGALSGGGE